MLDAGVELLNERKIDFSIDALGYRSVFDHLEQSKGVRVTYGSVHERIWASQRDFQLAVLTAAVEAIPEQNFDTFAGPALEAVTTLPLETAADRRYAAQELTRVAMNANWESSPPGYDLLRTLRYLVASLDTGSEGAELLVELIAGLRAKSTELYADVVRQLIGALSMRPRLPLTADQAAEALARASNGAITGYDIDNAVMDIPSMELATGPNGEMQSWHQAAWTTWLVTRGLFELDGDLPDAERVL